MPRKYVDYIIPEDPHSLTEMLEVGALLGFSQFWVDYRRVKQKNQLDQLSNRIGIVPRLDIDQQDVTKDKIIPILRQQRRRIPIIAIKCYDSEISSWAAQDNRIDILSFPLQLIGRLFTRSVAKLMIKFSKNLEISLVDLYNVPERQQIPTLRHLQQVLKIAVLKKVPIIFNSGSRTKFDLKAPLDLTALVQHLLPSQSNVIDTLSRTPFQLTQENLIKISEDYISPGVYKKRGVNRLNEIENTIKEEEE
ncbi:MAG: RNase P subunit p30 family protein [Candidatus Hodarchaeales archaeon]|jgi:RNase P/RNase MRP subunit p30